MKQNRYRTKPNAIAKETGERHNESTNTAPKLGRYVVEFPFSDLDFRPEFDLRFKKLAAVEALAQLSNAQLRLNHRHDTPNGCTREEIVEVMVQKVVVCRISHHLE